MRRITLYSTIKNEAKHIDTDVRIWGDLRNIVESHGFPLNNMSCRDSVTKCNFEHADASLPEGNFILFISPLQTKSGAEDLTGADLRLAIAGLISIDGEQAASHFNRGRNYTIKGNDELSRLYKSYLQEDSETVCFENEDFKFHDEPVEFENCCDEESFREEEVEFSIQRDAIDILFDEFKQRLRQTLATQSNNVSDEELDELKNMARELGY